MTSYTAATIMIIINNIYSNSGFVLENNIEEYVTSRAKYVDKGKGPEFKQAVHEIDNFLKDPTVRVKF